jgi:hypothetical protein
LIFSTSLSLVDHVTFSGEHQRVVGNGLGFDRQHFGRLTELGQAGAQDLWLAAQGEALWSRVSFTGCR